MFLFARTSLRLQSPSFIGPLCSQSTGTQCVSPLAKRRRMSTWLLLKLMVFWEERVSQHPASTATENSKYLPRDVQGAQVSWMRQRDLLLPRRQLGYCVQQAFNAAQTPAILQVFAELKQNQLWVRTGMFPGRA